MPDHTDLAFDRAFASLLQAERQHRQSLAARLAATRALLVEAALALAPALIDQRLAADPRFLDTLDEPGWAALLVEARRHKPVTHGSLHAQSLQAEVEVLRRQVADLQTTIAAQTTRLAALQDELARNRSPAASPSHPLTVSLPPPLASAPSLPMPGSLALPPLPADPPVAVMKHFPGTLWQRGRLLIAILTLTGWSYQRAGLDELARLVGVSAGAGSLKRLLERLARQGLLRKETVPAAPSRVAVAWLTAPGRQAAEAMGLVAVESEWERLARLHGGERQQGHAALVCLFAYHARRLGYATQVCPPVDGSADPDVLLTRGDEAVYVEVEAESGSVERRMRKWRNQAALQGYVALCAPTPDLRQRLTVEAHAAAKRGFATDLTSLRAAESELWVQTW